MVSWTTASIPVTIYQNIRMHRKQREGAERCFNVWWRKCSYPTCCSPPDDLVGGSDLPRKIALSLGLNENSHDFGMTAGVMIISVSGGDEKLSGAVVLAAVLVMRCVLPCCYYNTVTCYHDYYHWEKLPLQLFFSFLQIFCNKPHVVYVVFFYFTLLHLTPKLMRLPARDSSYKNSSMHL